MMTCDRRSAGFALAAALALAVPVSLANAQAAPDLSAMSPDQRAKLLEQLSKVLIEADANVDGKTTRQELATHRADQFAKLDRNKDGVVSEADAPRVPMLKKKFNEAFETVVPQYDTDKDGTMTRAEWNTQKRDPFELLDADGDGAISRAEIPTPEMLQATGS